MLAPPARCSSGAGGNRQRPRPHAAERNLVSSAPLENPALARDRAQPPAVLRLDALRRRRRSEKASADRNEEPLRERGSRESRRETTGHSKAWTGWPG